MYKHLISVAFALAFATPALAQNDNEPVIGRASAESRVATFTAEGTYGDLPSIRLIDVVIDADGDGVKDAGVLRVSCTGGDMITGTFIPGGSVAEPPAGVSGKPKAGKAAAASAFAAGKTFKGRWASVRKGNERGVTLNSAQADVCSGLG